MHNWECVLDELWSLDKWWLLVGGDYLLEKVLIRGGHRAGFVEQAKDADWILIEQVNHWLIVCLFYVLEGRQQPICFVLVLLGLEDVGHLELLQSFIGEVYAHLLKRVMFEVLEAKNIKEAYGYQAWSLLRRARAIVSYQGGIHFVYKPVK